MIKGMIEKIEQMALAKESGKPFEYGERHWYRTDSGEIKEILPRDFTAPDKIVFHTLSGLVSYLHNRGREDLGREVENVFLIVGDTDGVMLCGCIDYENFNKRFIYVAALLKAKCDFRFDSYYDLEMFIIRLQTHFVPSPTVDRIITMLANVANDHVVTATDDKFTQKLAVKTGITTKEEVRVENPVMLAPYRTFREVEQPELPFVLRLRNGKEGMEAALFEAGGDAWKLVAMQRIADYLRAQGGMPPVFA